MIRTRISVKVWTEWLRYIRAQKKKHLRFFPLTPFFYGKCILWDSVLKEKINFEIRDEIDIQIVKHLFLHEGYLIQHPNMNNLVTRYNKIIEKNRTPLIIDCGSNRGFTINYFLRLFPHSRIIAVEPDNKNVELAKRNNSHGDIVFLKACIGSESGRATITDPNQGHWAFRTKVCQQGDLPVITINQLLEESDDLLPLLIKIDIEGFEENLFSCNTEWFDRFPLLIIELHDWMLPGKSTSRPFLSEMGKRNRDFIIHGENVFSFSNL